MFAVVVFKFSILKMWTNSWTRQIKIIETIESSLLFFLLNRIKWNFFNFLSLIPAFHLHVQYMKKKCFSRVTLYNIGHQKNATQCTTEEKYSDTRMKNKRKLINFITFSFFSFSAIYFLFLFLHVIDSERCNFQMSGR